MPQQRVARTHNPKQRRRKIQMLVTGFGAVLLAVVLVAAMTDGRDGDKEVDQTVSSVAASEKWSTGTYAGGPRLTVDRTEVAYGDVDYGDPVEAVYRLKNIGDETVIIDEPSIKTLEGC